MNIKMIMIAIITAVAVLISQFGILDRDPKPTVSISGDLTRFEYFNGGNENGNRKEIYLKEDDQHRLILGISNAEWWSQRPIVTERVVSGEYLERLQEIFFNSGMDQWGDLPESEEFVLDGANSYFTFYFEDGRIEFDTYDELPSYDGILQIYELLDEAEEKGDLLPGLIMEPQTEEEMMTRPWPEDGMVSLGLWSLFDGDLHYQILNGTEEEFAFEASARLIRVSDDTVICEAEERSVGTLESHEYFDEFLELPGRLEAGTYRLELGELTVEFEIG